MTRARLEDSLLDGSELADGLLEGWEIGRLKYRLRSIYQGWSPECEQRQAEPGEWGVLKVGCMNSGIYDETENKALPSGLTPDPSLEIKTDDVLMSRSNTIDLVGAVGRVHQTRGRILLCDKLYRLVFDERKLDPRYAVYLLRSHIARQQIERDASGASSSMKNISNDRVERLVLPYPPLTVQRQIVSFLDDKTARINSLLEKKEKLIALLHEKRQVLISEAVTKGLDRDAPLKRTGIEWLGRVPRDWSVVSLGYLVRVVSGSTPSKNNPAFWGGDVPWVSPKDMKQWEIGDSEDHITQDALRESGIALIPPPAVLLVVRGMILARDVPVAVTTAPVTINQDMKSLIPRAGLSASFLAHVLRSIRSAFFAILEESGHGTKCLRTDLWKKVRIAVPDQPTQRRICEHINVQSACIGRVVQKIGQQIARLRAYRHALVSAAVTGQISVGRGVTEVQPVAEKPVVKPNPYFRRTVLAAEIIDRMCAQPTFGHVKFQKCLFVAQHHLRLEDFEENYQRASAGPYDNRLIRSIDSQLEKQRWFRAEQVGDRYSYKRMDRAGNHKKYFEGYFGDKADQLSLLLDLFRPLNTDRAEIVATLYAVWNDFLIQKQKFDDDRIIKEVLTNWDEAKTRFPEDRWRKALDWMKEKGLVPSGFGKPTLTVTDEK